MVPVLKVGKHTINGDRKRNAGWSQYELMKLFKRTGTDKREQNPLKVTGTMKLLSKRTNEQLFSNQ